jgi:YhcH/YjgK/YiaL family protein
MIFDSWANFSSYVTLHPRFAQVLEFVQRQPLDQLPDGKHEIDGQNLFVIVSEYDTKLVEDCIFEAHRKYIDVQVMLRGEERMGVAPLSRVESVPYQEERDLTILRGDADFLLLSAGYFTIFFPQDGHIPGVMNQQQPGKVRKAVFKVASRV